MVKSKTVLIEDWARFYAEIGIKVDLSDLVIPEKKQGFDYLIIIAQGLTPNQLFNVCVDRFQDCECDKKERDLDEAVSSRNSEDGHYAVWVDGCRNSKHNNRALLDGGEITEKTLVESLLLELKYYEEEKKHFHINLTICLDQYLGGWRPSVEFNSLGWGDKFAVYNFYKM